MSQTNELDNVKRKIRALTEKTVDNGATEAEAFAAMTKVGELLNQYNLSMDEITLRLEKCITDTFFTHESRDPVASQICVYLARFCGVKVWLTRGLKEKSYKWGDEQKTYKTSNHGPVELKFFGLESDVQLALYLCGIVTQAEKSSLAEFVNSDTYRKFSGHRKIATNNFKKGFHSRINARLYELWIERKKANQEASQFHAETMKDRMVGMSEEAAAAFARQTTGTALVMVAKEKMVDEEFGKLGMKLRNVYSQSHGKYHSGSREAGASAANRVNFNRPVGGSSANGYIK